MVKPQPSPILGTAYRSRSRALADQRMVNLYLEMVETKTGKAPGALYDCPGLTYATAVGSGPIRPGGLHAVTPSLYAVSGSQFLSLDVNFASTLIGNVATTSGPVTMIDNGTQVAISDQSQIYALSGGTFGPVSIPFNNPGTLVYQDTLGFVNQVGTSIIWQSNVNDLTTWNALNFTVEDGSSDPIVGLAQLHRQLIVLKESHIAFYVNVGQLGFVMQRLDGVYPDVGCAAAASIANVGDEICWLGRDRYGMGRVYVMGGFEPKAVSTYAIEYAISTYPTISDAVGWGYFQEGHRFYCLSFPSANVTWVLDLSASAQIGVPVWHQRAAFANGILNIYEPDCGQLFNGNVIVGSSTGPNLYKLDLENVLDNGKARKRLRSWRAQTENSRLADRFNSLEIDMQCGYAPSGTNPLVVLRYSDDNATWSSERFTPAGQIGDYQNRVRFRRLGMSRRGLSSDRVFELSTTDNFKMAIFGAYIT